MGTASRIIGELALIVAPSLDPAPAAAPKWAKRLRVSLKLWKRGKREAKSYTARQWTGQTGAQLKAAVLAQQAANEAEFARHYAMLQADSRNEFPNPYVQQSALAGLQNAANSQRALIGIGSGIYRPRFM